MMRRNFAIIIAVCITMTTFSIGSVSAFAEVDYDSQAIARGYVARIGEAEDAYDGGSFSGYYKFLDSTYSVGYTPEYDAAFDFVDNYDVITLIADVDMRAKSGYSQIGKNGVTLQGAEGRDITLYRLGNFLCDGQVLTIKNLNVSLEKDNACFASVKNGGVLTVENCTLFSKGKLESGLIQMLGGNLDVKDSSVFLGEYDSEADTYGGIEVSGSRSDRASLVYASAKTTVTLDGVFADLTNSPDLQGIFLEKGGTVDLTDTVIKTVDNCISLSGKSSSSVFVKGNSYIRSEGGNAISAVGCTGAFSLSMNGDSKLFGALNALDVSDVNNVFSSVDISLSDKCSVEVGDDNGTAFLIGEHKATVSLKDEVCVRASIPFGITQSNKQSVFTVADTVNVAGGGEVVAPKMQQGASVRILEGANGIRFCASVRVEKIAKAKDHGILLVKYGDLKSCDLTVYEMDKKGITYAKISAIDDNGSGVEQGEDGTLSFKVVLKDIPESEISTKFAVRAYAVYDMGGVDVYVYSDFDAESNARSMANVAYAALGDTKPQKSDEYKYEVETGVWSPYTKEQYQTIKRTYGDLAEPIGA